MKKIISIFAMMSMFALMPLATERAFAAPASDMMTTYDMFEMNESSGGCPAGTYKVRKNTRTKKKLVNSLIAGGIGAAVGGGIGGGRGALIGLGSGAGGYLIYRYVRDRKGRCVPRLVRRG